MTDFQRYLDSYCAYSRANNHKGYRRLGDTIALGFTTATAITGAMAIAWEALTTMEPVPDQKACEWLFSPHSIQKDAGRAWLDLPADIRSKYGRTP